VHAKGAAENLVPGEAEGVAELRGPAAIILESAFSSIADVAASFVPWPHGLHAFIHRHVIFRFESAAYARNLTKPHQRTHAPPIDAAADSLPTTAADAAAGSAAAGSAAAGSAAAGGSPSTPSRLLPSPPPSPPLRLLQLHAQEDSLVAVSLGRRLFRALPATVRARWLDAPAPATHDAVFVANADMQRAASEMLSELRAETTN
jgi:hypothetical protein